MTDEQETDVITPKRAKFGRGTTHKKPTFHMLREARQENYTWITLLSWTVFNIIVAYFIIYVTVTRILDLFPESTTLDSIFLSSIIPAWFFTEDALKIVLTVSGIIALRIISNVLVQILGETSLKKHKDVLLSIVSGWNIILSLASAFIIGYVVYAIHYAIYHMGEYWGVVHAFVFSELFDWKAKLLLILIDVDIVIFYVLFIALAIKVFLSSVSSIKAFINSFILQTPKRTLNKYSITNYSPYYDDAAISSIYRNSSPDSDARLSDTDFDKFIKEKRDQDAYIRVALLKDEIVGFSVSQKADNALEEVFVSKDHRGQGLGIMLINDFEKMFDKKTKKAYVLGGNPELLEHLFDNGWVDESVEGMKRKTFIKYR